MLHGGTDGELEADLGAGLDLGGFGAPSVLEGALVADDIIQIRRRTIADVLPLDGVVLGRASACADVLVAVGLAAVDDQLVEEVMPVGGLSQGGEEGDRGELHCKCKDQPRSKEYTGRKAKGPSTERRKERMCDERAVGEARMAFGSHDLYQEKTFHGSGTLRLS